MADIRVVDGPDGECGMPVESTPCSIHYPGMADR